MAAVERVRTNSGGRSFPQPSIDARGVGPSGTFDSVLPAHLTPLAALLAQLSDDDLETTVVTVLRNRPNVAVAVSQALAFATIPENASQGDLCPATPKECGARRLIVCGGRDTTADITASVEELIVLDSGKPTSSWAPLPSLSQGRSGPLTVVTSENKIFVCGGRGSNDEMAQSSVEIFDASAALGERWQPGPSMNSCRNAPSGAVVEGTIIYVCGGEDQEGHTLNSTEVLHTTRLGSEGGGCWQAGPAMTSARYGSTAAVLGGDIYVIGGADLSSKKGAGVTAHRSVEVLCSPGSETATSASGVAWRPGPLLNTRRCFAAAASPRGVLHVAGGSEDMFRALQSVEILDRALGSWRLGPNLISPRIGATAVPLSGGKILVLGGRGHTFDARETTEVLSPSCKSWVNGPPLSSGRFDTSVIGLVVVVDLTSGRPTA
eukprot:TRINITY_DN25998_c0_g1_i1.p1 TRINITY_DN25998_c0_g1~~TRINITY_DN25998_c0_g1_i1.p1  ORF type:complete len:435 (+),score=63.14 TRINITY_DN25998_c0_g1_i1:129-1433(+)